MSEAGSIINDCVEASIRDIERATYSGRIKWVMEGMLLKTTNGHISFNPGGDKVSIGATEITIDREKMAVLTAVARKGNSSVLFDFRKELRKALGQTPELDMIFPDTPPVESTAYSKYATDDTQI